MNLERAIEAHRAGRLGEAEGIYRQILAREPGNVDALHLLGVIALEMGKLDVAIELIGRAVAVKPEFAQGHYNLGNAFLKSGQAEKAAGAYRRAIELKPDFVKAHNNLGTALKDLGELDAAMASFQRAIELQPDCAEAFNNLGMALVAKDRGDLAAAAFERAIECQADYPTALHNLAAVLVDRGEIDRAIGCYERAIRLKPDYAEAWSDLGNARLHKGQVDLAIAAYRRAMEIMPDYAGAHSNLLLALNFDSERDSRSTFAEHRAWGERFGRVLGSASAPHANNRDPERRLRIGYVSGDFRRHAVANFILPVLKHHNRTRFEIVGYSNVKRPDDVSARIEGCCEVWRRIEDLSDERVAEVIREDGIDILVDLSGHTSGNWLLAMARKPAPVQVTYLGYPNTTGLAAIDYRLSDAAADPPGAADELNVEKLWRLKGCAWCYEPWQAGAELRRRPEGTMTFGCFSYYAKITARMVEIWAEILRRTPGARLLLKYAAMVEESCREGVRQQFARHGIGAERLDLRGWIADSRRHLELHNEVDVMLDTYPYHGTTTTCEALWMGVPVVTFAGATHISRVGVSLLRCAGLPELIAPDAGEYVRIAAELAADRTRREAMRARLVGGRGTSPLFDGRRMAGSLESAFREMWKAWCR